MQPIYHKEFCQDNFTTNDAPSRKAVLTYFNSKGFKFRHNPDTFDIDIISDSLLQSIEIERRSIWKGDKYPYPSYHFLHRKKKYFIGEKRYVPNFMVLNEDYSKALCISRAALLPYLDDNNLTTIYCHSFKRPESVYEVPIDKFNLLTLN